MRPGNGSGQVIVEEQVVVTVPVAQVLDRLGRALNVGGFDQAVSADFADAHTSLVRAGVAGVTKRVAVRALPPVVSGADIVIAIRWEAVGLTGELYPTLDANLIVRPREDETVLDLVGSYTPPFGRVGAALDQLLLGQVARASLRAFLAHLAVTATSTAPALAEDALARESAEFMGGPETGLETT